MKCCACRKEITEAGKLISCDGDFVCDDECHKDFHREMDAVCGMSDSQFEHWLTGRNEIYPANDRVEGRDLMIELMRDKCRKVGVGDTALDIHADLTLSALRREIAK